MSNAYTATLNGTRTTTFTNPTAANPPPPTPSLTTTGFLGLPTHTGRVAFRHIRITDP